jgi:iron complex transport system substrate-binding protein
METLKRFSLLLTLIVSLFSCGNHPKTTSFEHGDTLALRYAQGFLIIMHDDAMEVQIIDPWHEGRILQQTTLKKPLQKAAVFTSANAALLNELGCLHAIGGVCEPQYIADTCILHAISDGTIHDLGSAMTPNLEALITLSADAILLSAFENTGGYGGLDRLGIPLIWCADYMEPSALARAEWMRLYGRLFGCGERADSLFAEVEARYLALKEANDTVRGFRPTVIFDDRKGSAWYMPGGRSTLAALTRDAGGDYLFADNEDTGSVPFSFEEVYAKGHEADIWLYRYSANEPLTLDALRRQYEPYAQFRAFRTGQVYGCNMAENIFFQEYPFHPERLLADFTHIFAGDTTALRYFHPLK